MLSVTCQRCGKAYRCQERLAGKRVRCGQCGAAVEVPPIPLEGEPRRARTRSPRRFPPPPAAPGKKPSGATREVSTSWLRRPPVLIGAMCISATLVLVLGLIGIDARSRNATPVDRSTDQAIAASAPNVPEKLTVSPTEHWKDPHDEPRVASKDGDPGVQEDLQQRERERQDPNYKQTAWLEGKLKEHPFFKRVSYEKVVSQQFVFFIEQPRKQDPAYYEQLAAKHTPWLRELEDVFVREYAGPLQLSRKTPHASHALSVLSSAAHYHNEYAQLVGDPGLAYTAAHYLPALRMVTTFEDSVLPVEAGERRSAILHELVHSLQHQFYSESDDMPKPLWFVEGLAEYLSAGKLENAGALRQGRLDEEYLRQYLRLKEIDPQGIYLNSLTDLVSVEGPGYGAIIDLAVKRAQAQGTASSSGFFVVNANWAQVAFYRQAYLLMHYLHQGAEERHRPGFQRYFKLVMKGGRGLKAFQDAHGVDPGAMEKDFNSYLENLKRRHFPGGVLDAGESMARFLARLFASKPAAKPERRPSFDPRALDLAADEWQAQLGLALRRASQSRLDEAIRSLEGARDRNSDSGIKKRLNREANRLGVVRDLRREFLEDAAEKHLTLLFGSERREVLGVDTAAGKVRLRIGKGTREAPLESLPMKELLQRAKDKMTGGQYWLAPYLKFICGASSKDLLKDAVLGTRQTSAARELREDLAGDLEQVRGLGDAAEAILELTASEPGAPAEKTDAALKSLQTLLSKHGGKELVSRRKEGLKSLAATLIEPGFDSTRSSHLGMRVLERLPNGRIKVAHGLAGQWGMEDFVPEDGYLDGMRRLNIQAGNLDEIPSAVSSGFRIQGKELVGSGGACLRLALPLAAPLEARMKFRFTPEMGGQKSYFFLGLCGDDEERYLGIDWFGGLLCSDGVQQRHVAGSNLEWDWASIYEMEVRHTGSQLEATVYKHKRKVSEQRLEGLSSGQVGSCFLWVHSRAPFAIVSLEVTGRLDDSSLPGLKARWVESEVKKLFP